MTESRYAASARTLQNRRRILKYLSWGLAALAVALFFVGYLTRMYNVWFWGSMLALASNCLYALENLKRRTVFLVFQGTYFLFLMSRPLVRGLRGQGWWNIFLPGTVSSALTALFVGLVGLRLGAQGLEWLADRTERRYPGAQTLPNPEKDETFLQNLRSFALLAFAVTMAAYLAQELLALLYMQGRNYEEYFLNRPDPPFPIGTLAAMMPTSLALYLAALPKKRQAFLPMAVYVLSAVPSFIIGVRNPLMLRLLFCFMYYCLRDGLDNGQIWVGRIEKAAVIVSVLPITAGLGAYNYFRAGEGIGKLNFFGLLVDFFDKQGTSFYTLCRGFSVLPKMPSGMRWYTFGPLIDTVSHGRIAQALFGASPLGSGNSVAVALYGHSFAHSVSYAWMTKGYLQGHGLGSSFLLESYADFGWVGVVVFSVLLGAALIGLTVLFHRGWFARTLALVCLTSVFFVPRAETTSWICFLVTPHFWLVLLCCRLAAGLWPKLKARIRPQAPIR